MIIYICNHTCQLRQESTHRDEKHDVIDQLQFNRIQLKTIDFSSRLWGIMTEFVAFIPQSLALRSIVLARLNFNLS